MEDESKLSIYVFVAVVIAVCVSIIVGLLSQSVPIGIFTLACAIVGLAKLFARIYP